MTDERSPNMVDKRLGQRMRARRLEIGMSQDRLADLLGITFQQVQKYEKGVNRIAASRLFAICEALDMTVAKMFEGLASTAAKDEGETEATFIEDVLATPDGVQLVALFSRIENARVRRRVVDLVRVMIVEDEDEPQSSLPQTARTARGDDEELADHSNLAASTLEGTS